MDDFPTAHFIDFQLDFQGFLPTFALILFLVEEKAVQNLFFS